MTRERALELAWEILTRYELPGEHFLLGSQIADAILAAVAEEREECAKIADAADGLCHDDKWDNAASYIANEIRERGLPPKDVA